MSLLQINPGEIQAFKFTKSEKIIKMSLQNLLKQGNDAIGLVEIELFGISHVYSLIDFSKVKSFNLSKLINDSYTTGVQYFRKEYQEIIPFSLAKIMDDCPIEKDINMLSNTIMIDSLNVEEWILLYQLKNIISGMNEYSNDISYMIGFGDSIEDDNCPFILSKLDFGYSDNSYPFHKYKYILKYPNDEFEFCNEIYNDDFEGVFIHISNFNCWQYLSKKKYKTLKQAKRIDIAYATTDSPSCFSNVGYHQEYNIDTFIDLIMYGIYIPIDIYLSKVFENSIINNTLKNRYDAIEIRIEGREYKTSVLLTHSELGINQTFGTIKNVNCNPFEENSLRNCVRYMDKFCLLKLINKIILLKP